MTLLLYVLLICSCYSIPLLSQPKRLKLKSAPYYYQCCTSLQKGPVTIYIHGTVFPLISRVFHKHEVKRRGLYHYRPHKTPPNNLAEALATTDSRNYPSAGFYKFYWSGKLSHAERQQAAYELFNALKNHTGAITLIGHSHGCSIALYLAKIAEQTETYLSIDRLILLAPPVQQATKCLVASSLFKRVYSCYSFGDMTQILDPQRLYSLQKAVPFFSERTFHNTDHLIQAEIQLDGTSPGHQAFVQPSFFKHLPHLIEILDACYKQGARTITLNIPAQKP